MHSKIYLAAVAALMLNGAAQAQTATPATPAMPEAGTPEAEMLYQSARNQLGVLKHCNEQGFIGEEAVATQTKLLGMIPAGDVALGDAAEEKGAGGTVVSMGTELTLEDGAKQQSTTPEAMCKQMETAMAQLASQLPAE
ncbi:pore-forming ESAT-6 family protein [uncultured Paracoccus sp.]|uniref:pore-forming ESAT-6 family protein n=1 Tax=uncultured Paracoccus sp. TaxID=189685 RepID=UPI002618878D|nr:pore-forming ESAT-6 family protein [uncultured Paracoccus sp.]